MERILPNFSCLTHLTLHTKGSADLADGYRWERLSAGLIVFNFKFEVIVWDIQQMLDSFRTPFWLQEKCWYVAYDDKCLFSVPKFAPKHVFTSYNPRYFTAPDETFLYNNITTLTISESAEPDIHHFNHVETLELRCHRSSHLGDMFSSIFNTSRKQHGNLKSLDRISLLLHYLHTMPHCCTLSINIELTLEFIDQLSDNQFKQIRTLEFQSSTTITRYVIEGILHIFPRVERLRISYISSKMDMIRLIDGFKYLANASFMIKSNFTESERHWFYNPDLSIRGVRRLKYDTFTCRFDRSSAVRLSCSVHIWINEQVSGLMLDYYFLKLCI